jgi:hypothetical protein
MRMNRIYDMDGWTDVPADNADAGLGKEPEPAPAPAAGSPEPSKGTIETAPSPSQDPKPGPNNNPAPQGGNPPAQQPPPPAVVSSVPGIKGSEATGGVQGSFEQAGTGGFNRRFGLPAAWFKGGPTAGLAREASNKGRSLLGKERAGQVSGGFGAETVGVSPTGPSQGLEGGGKNDEEWQRLIAQVLKSRFSRG